jgi:hypothetical protein
MVKKPHFDATDENDVYGQHKWREIPCDPRDFNNFEAPDYQHSEQDCLLKEARTHARQLLFERLLQLVDFSFTQHQKNVFILMRQGKTYQQIALSLHNNYSSLRSGYTSVAYAIKGIKSRMHHKHHGGIERKLQKLCMRDKYCQDILQSLKKLETDDISVAIDYLKKFDEWFVKYDTVRDKDEV